MAKVRVQREDPDAEERAGRFWRWMMGRPLRMANTEALWHPAVDIYNRPEEIVVEVELPGMRGQDVDVSLEEQHLLIQGSRPEPEGEEGTTYYRERPVGDFHRVIHLPVDVDAERAEASYDDGVLTVTLPRAKRAGARKIEIR
ncbi:MAG: Hsp20/alpha crystallin family protein [Candidatus Brocadiaceae bacterium]|jgi:HSP20 family protein